jgi:hypothetical protein
MQDEIEQLRIDVQQLRTRTTPEDQKEKTAIDILANEMERANMDLLGWVHRQETSGRYARLLQNRMKEMREKMGIFLLACRAYNNALEHFYLQRQSSLNAATTVPAPPTGVDPAPAPVQ